MPVKAHGPDEAVYKVRLSKRHHADIPLIARVLYERGLIGKNVKGHLDAKAAMETIIDHAKRALGIA